MRRVDTHSPGVFKKKPGFPRIRHFKNHMPPNSQLKRRNFSRAVAVDASIQQRVLLPGGGGCRGRSPRGGPHVSPGVDGIDLSTARTWAAGAWIWGAGHSPAFGPGDRRPLNRASPVSAALRRSRLLFLPLLSPLGWGVTPVSPLQGDGGGERRGLGYKQPVARRRSTSAPAGPWVALCGTRKSGPREGLQGDMETSERRQVPRAGCASSQERLARVQVLAFLASSGPVRALSSPGSSAVHTQDSSELLLQRSLWTGEPSLPKPSGRYREAEGRMRPFACWTRYLFTPQLVDATGTFQIHVRETPRLRSYKKATVALSDNVISTTPPAREVRWARRLSCCHRHRQQTAVCKTAWLPGDKRCVS